MAAPERGTGVSGITINGLFIDELHEIKSRQSISTLMYGIKNELDPMVILGSNSGRTSASVVGEWWGRGSEVLNGNLEMDDFLPMLCGPADGADLADPDVWKGVNPSMIYGSPRERQTQAVLDGARGSPSQVCLLYTSPSPRD